MPAKKINLIISLIVYIVIAVLIYIFNDNINSTINGLIKIILALGGIFILIDIFKEVKKSFLLDTFKNYTFQIFLMHTIFAAGIRLLMYKIGIENYAIHIIIGLLFSIYIPVLVSIISNKLKFTNFFFCPLRTIEEYKKGK